MHDKDRLAAGRQLLAEVLAGPRLLTDHELKFTEGVRQRLRARYALTLRQRAWLTALHEKRNDIRMPPKLRATFA